MADASDPTMEVPLEQRNLQRNLNQLAMEASQAGGGNSTFRGRDGDRMMIDETDRTDDERRDGIAGHDFDYSRPWYMPGVPFWQQGGSGGGTPSPPPPPILSAMFPPPPSTATTMRSSPTNTTSSSERYDDLDCREEDIIMEREGGGDDYDDYNQARIHEPLKRMQEEHEQEEVPMPMPRNVRRRVGEATSIAYANILPALTERQQAVVEYSAPSVFTPLFFVLGYTRFAVGWVMVMYTGHFLQTALSTFGPENALSWKQWITPLYHHLMDTYIWNHSMITTMLLYPEWFGDTAYWLAVFFTMGQQQAYLVVSLKTHYVNHKHKIANPKDRHQIELSFMDCFLLYGLGAFSFTVARVFDVRYLLWIGLVEFNLAPAYLVWAHKNRMDFAIARKKQSSGSSNPQKKGDAKEKEEKEEDTSKEEETDEATKKEQ